MYLRSSEAGTNKGGKGKKRKQMIIANNPLSVSIPGSYDIKILVVVLADYTYVYTSSRISSFTIILDLLK